MVLGRFFEILREFSANIREKLSAIVRKKPSRFLENGAKFGNEVVSRKTKAASSTNPDEITFCQTDKSLDLREFTQLNEYYKVIAYYAFKTIFQCWRNPSEDFRCYKRFEYLHYQPWRIGYLHQRGKSQSKKAIQKIMFSTILNTLEFFVNIASIAVL